MSITVLRPGGENARAALFVVLAMAAFTCNDAIVKHLSDSLPIAEILVYRGLLVSGFFLLLMRLQSSPQTAPVTRFANKWNLIRGAIELLVTFLFLTGVMLLPLATATILIFAGPIVMTGLAALILKEQVGIWRWSAVAAGFLGVVIIANPQGGAWDWAILFPLAAAILTAFRDIAVRFVPTALSSADISLTTAVLVMFGGLAITLFRGFNSLTGTTALFLLLGAGFLCVAYFFYVLATRTGELSFIAPFKYISILLAFLLDAVIWQHLPSHNAILGGAVIVAAGLIILYREGRQQSRTRSD